MLTSKKGNRMTELIKLTTDAVTNLCIGLSIQTLILAIFNIVVWFLPFPTFFSFEYGFLYSLYLCKIIPDILNQDPEYEELSVIINEGAGWVQTLLGYYQQLFSNQYLQPLIKSTPALIGLTIYFYIHLPTTSLLTLGIVYISIRMHFGKKVSHQFVNFKMMLLSPLYAIFRWQFTQNIFYPLFLFYSISISVFLNALNDHPAENLIDHLLNYLILTISLGPLVMLTPNLPIIHSVTSIFHPFNRIASIAHSLCATYILGSKCLNILEKTEFTSSTLISHSKNMVIPPQLNPLNWIHLNVQRPN